MLGLNASRKTEDSILTCSGQKKLKIYPHGDDGLLRSGSSPQNEGKESEENEETDNESQKITPARNPLTANFIVEPFFLNRIKSLFSFPVMLILAAFPRSRSERSGISSGGRVPGLTAGRAAGAEDRRRVKGVGSLLAVVGVTRWTLDVKSGVSGDISGNTVDPPLLVVIEPESKLYRKHVQEAAFKAACPIVKPSFLKPTRGETPVRSTQSCFPPIHPKTKISAGLRVDLPSNGSVRKLTGASFLADIPARLNTSKRTSLTMSCRYLKPGRSLQCTACSPNESKHALRQIGHNSSTGNNWALEATKAKEEASFAEYNPKPLKKGPPQTTMSSMAPSILGQRMKRPPPRVPVGTSSTRRKASRCPYMIEARGVHFADHITVEEDASYQQHWQLFSWSTL
ncbi:hypothetical protein LXL04_013539 [Taraxacum kok-saghyz]